jgi:hypothetical protein
MRGYWLSYVMVIWEKMVVSFGSKNIGLKPKNY